MNCLFSIVATSTAHQYTVPLFWGTCAECAIELVKRETAAGHSLGLKIARIEDLHSYNY